MGGGRFDIGDGSERFTGQTVEDAPGHWCSSLTTKASLFHDHGNDIATVLATESNEQGIVLLVDDLGSTGFAGDGEAVEWKPGEGIGGGAGARLYGAGEAVEHR